MREAREPGVTSRLLVWEINKGINLERWWVGDHVRCHPHTHFSNNLRDRAGNSVYMKSSL